MKYLIKFLILGVLWGKIEPVKAQNSIEKDSLYQIHLKNVNVYGKDLTRRNSLYQYTPLQVRSLVTVLGEPDVMRYVGTLPGVTQGIEGTMGFFIRGGNSGNNRIELDGVPVYGATHLFGFFSSFHSDIVQDVEFRSGGMPASSGNLLSALSQITTLQPDTQKYHGGFSISPYMLGGSVNGPLSKKVSFQLAARISLLAAEYKLLHKTLHKVLNENLESDLDFKGDVKPWVTDVYFKLYFHPQERKSFTISGYISNDYFKYQWNKYGWITNSIRLSWGNEFVRFGWENKLSEYCQMRTMAYVNHFYAGQKWMSQKDIELPENIPVKNDRIRTALYEVAFQKKLQYNKKNWSIEAGIEGKFQHFQPAVKSVQTTVERDEMKMGDQPNAGTLVLFGEMKYAYKILQLKLGIREALFLGDDRNFFNTDVHVSSLINFKRGWGIEMDYDYLTQYQHVMEGLPVGWSLDMVIPASRLLPPEKAHQIYLGSFYSHGFYYVSVGGYYKNMKHLASYKNASNIFGIENSSWEEEVCTGEGESYGMEIRAEKKGRDWNATLSYTLSKTDRQFDEINKGRKFPFRFDRRHVLNLTGRILIKTKEKKQQYLNLGLAYASGHYLTIPQNMYKGVLPPYWGQALGGISSEMQELAYSRQLMSDINAYKMTDYFRMDIGYTFQKQGKHHYRELTIGVYNIFNRKNPYLLFYDENKWKQLSIMPVIPSIQWTMRF